MAVRRKYTVPELLDLADRMIGRGTSSTLDSNHQLKADCLACGLILADLLLMAVITEAIILSDGTSPPIAPE